MAVDPVKSILQDHLKNVANPKAPSMILGNPKSLETLVKISQFYDTNICLAHQEYPNLPKRQYLVAKVDRYSNDVQVIALYNFAQFQELWQDQQNGRPHVKSVEWCIMEIPENVEKELKPAKKGCCTLL